MTDIKKVVDKNLEKKFEVKISNQELKKQIDKEATEQKEKIKLDGFRKGKVPLDFIKDKYSAVLLADASQKLVENTVSELIKEHNFNLISRPKIDVKKLEIEKDFEFEITFELFPEIPEIKYNKINLKKQKVKIDKKDIEEGKNRLAKTKASWREEGKDYVAKNGDKVKIDFLGKVNGEAFEGGKAEGYDLELGSKSFIDTFEDQLIGKKANDELDVKVIFPKEYHKKDLAGQPAVFEVKIHSVSTSKTPELTNEFIKENFNLDSIEKLEEMIEKELSSMYEGATKNKTKGDIFEWFKKNIKIELPESVINDEFNRQWTPIENELKSNPNKFKNDKEKVAKEKEVKAQAEESVRLGLILSEIGKVNNIRVENSDLMEEIRKRSAGYPGQEQMIVDFYMKNQQALNQLTGLLLEEKVIDFITNKANVEEIEVSIEDFIKNK